MIVVKTKKEIASMKVAGRIAAQALQVGGEAAKPGTTTAQVDRAIEKFIRSQNAIPSFLGYEGFPASACISVNNQVIHGIPGKYVIQPTDIVSIDVGAIYDGFHGDNAATFAMPDASEEAKQLLTVTKECLERGIEAAKVGSRIGDISAAVQAYAEGHGYGVVYDFVGHGIGREMHEEPGVPNFGKAGHGPRLVAGMTIAIEPMINQFSPEVHVLKDGWTVLTKDEGLSAHFEHTIVITDNGPVILTLP